MKKKVWVGAGLVVAAIAWYAFRPEWLETNGIGGFACSSHRLEHAAVSCAPDRDPG